MGSIGTVQNFHGDDLAVHFYEPQHQRIIYPGVSISPFHLAYRFLSKLEAITDQTFLLQAFCEGFTGELKTFKFTMFEIVAAVRDKLIP